MEEEAKVSNHTVHSVWLKLGDRVSRYMYSHPVLFDKDETVEVDETREIWTIDDPLPYTTEITEGKGEWVLGLRSRFNDKVFLRPIEDRTTASVVDPILAHVELGATIISDALSSYQELTPDGYRHYTINKAQEGFSRYQAHTGFDEKVNVNSIEATWGQFRKYLNRHHKYGGRHVFYVCNYYMYDLLFDSYVNAIKLS